MPNNQAYADQLLQLAPPGKAWPRDRGSMLGLLCLAFGDEFGRLDARALRLIEEADPRTTNEMLADWERFTALPDPAIPTPVTLGDRRAALATRLLSRGDPRPAAFIALVAIYGFTATITTHTPFCADVGHADDLVYDSASIFWWELTIEAPIGTPTPQVALEHFVRRAIPDHTYVTFNYDLD
jgi:uncharacterized protein YmfQ (DUF2313 family)